MTRIQSVYLHQRHTAVRIVAVGVRAEEAPRRRRLAPAGQLHRHEAEVDRVQTLTNGVWFSNSLTTARK